MTAFERGLHAPPTWWLIAAFLIGELILFVFGSVIIKAVTASARNARSPLLERRAVVVSRRQEVWGEEYGLIADGDAGVLRSQGTKFLGFDRSHHGGEADA